MKIFILTIHAFRDLLIRYLPNFKKKEEFEMYKTLSGPLIAQVEI